MVGVSMVYSVASSRRKGWSKKEIYRKAFKRMIILSLLGIVYKNNPLHFDWGKIRYLSVLGRFGITGFFATFFLFKTTCRGRLFWLGDLLDFYGFPLFFI